MGIEIKDTKILLKKFDKLKDILTSPKIPFQIASDLRNLIVKRSKKGIGLRGRFKKYSTHPYYRSKKERPVARGGQPDPTGQTVFYEGGYREFAAATKGTDVPNLFASGQMFRQMQAKAVNNEMAQIIFLTENAAMKAIANNQDREFFGATSREKQLLSNSFNDLVKSAIKQAQL